MSTLLEQASLVLIPSGYKEDTVYSVIPSNGSGDLSFTRASNGTRINSDGLVENTPWNLASYSEQFNNGAWTKSASTVVADVITAPNGTLTADSFSQTATTTQHQVSQNRQYIAGNNYTASVYAKAGNQVTLVIVMSFTAFGANWRIAYFDLINGVVLSNNNNSGIAPTITSVGNGWYRCTFTNTCTTTISDALAFGKDFYSNLGDGQVNLYLWGAQLIEGSTAKPYFPTTDRLNVPRLTYQNGGGGCPSLLLEPQRTNLALHSEDFTNVVYTKTNVSATANTTTAPNGIQNADSILELATTSTHESYQRISMTSTQQYTQSCFLKANGRNRVCMQIFDNSTQYASAIYDLSTGVVVSSSGTAKIESMGNGWYRCAITGTSPATGLGYCVLGLCENTYTNSSVMQTYLGDITKGVYWWGFQLEAGAYATSYIPTTTASATRIADGFSRANVYTNGFITASGGTWFVEFTNNLTYTRDNGNNTLILADLLGTNFFRLRNDGSVNTTIRLQKSISGTTTDLFILPTGNVKIAVKWNGTTADAFLNGTKIVSATPFTATQLENLTSVPQVPIFISQMILFPTALSDSNCVTLTTI
jgi:hypothetical protein